MAGETPFLAYVLTAFLFFLLVAMIATYAYANAKFPDQTTRLVSTISILVGHMQTVSLVRELKVGWPPVTQRTFEATAALGISFNIGLTIARPECVALSNAGQSDFVQVCVMILHLATFLPSYLPTFLPSYLPTFPPSYLPTFLPSYSSPILPMTRGSTS